MHLLFLSLMSLASAAEVEGVVPPDPAPTVLPADALQPEPPPAPKQRVHEPGERPFLYGLLGLESLLYSRDIDLRDVTIVSSEVRGTLMAPTRAVREARDARWRRHFGSAELQATHTRLSDGERTAIALEDVPPVKEADGGRVCVAVGAATGQSWSLATWDDSTRGRVGANDQARGREEAPLFLANDEGSTTAMVHLAPGEAVTLVELAEGAKVRQKTRRRLTFKGAQRKIILEETAQDQTLCVDL